ncbi:MAG: hypothetical protein JWQ71_1978 [Pedosphaera sp.]|nr:hypothetical protein [Pedosphaera sp.]
MKKLFLLLIAGLFSISLHAETLQERYAKYGQVIFMQLPSAPFPHPERAQGRTRENKVYPADKHYSDSNVGIFIPRGFRPTDKVDFIVHFHGWNNHVERVFKNYQLIEQFVESGRNAILVVPQGPYDAPDSFDGKLEDEGGFKRFMADVMKTLRESNIVRSDRIGNIILSGHSGGYEAISGIVTVGGLSDHVTEVWLFDALYGRTEKFMNWFNNYHGKRLVNIYTKDGGTKKETEALMSDLKAKYIPFLAKNESEVTPPELKKNRLVFIYTDLEHDHVVNKRHEFASYLQTSVFSDTKAFAGPKWTRQ